MKQFRFIFLIAISGLILASCSKKTGEDDGTKKPETDLNVTLKNTSWAGEYQYTSGEYTGPQPFSVLLAADGTLSWTDLGSTRPGGKWVVKKDTMVITFPNNTSFRAIVDGDTWRSFSSDAAAGVQVNNVSRAEIPEEATLTNTNFSGTLLGLKAIIQFLPGKKLKFSIGSTDPVTVDYTIEGAGIRYNTDRSITTKTSVFGVFQAKMTSLKNVERWITGIPPKTSYYTWTANKIQL